MRRLVLLIHGCLSSTNKEAPADLLARLSRASRRVWGGRRPTLTLTSFDRGRNARPAPKILIARAVEPFAYDRIYSSWFGRVVATDAKAAVARSAERYERALIGSL